MRKAMLLAAALPCIAAAATVPTGPALAPSEIVAAAPASAWRAIPASELAVMTLGDGRRIVIQLAPEFAPVHVANIRALAKSGWFSGTSINRVQDNYVVQWGDATEKKPLPGGIVAAPPAEYERSAAGIDFDPVDVPDAYAAAIGHAGGWPVAADKAAGTAWLPHCYGMIGVGRGMPPDTGTGAELYVVIGHGPRHLDRNITVVGRVIEGIEALSALPRGTGALGFYERAEERVGIRSITLASDLPAAERPRFEVMTSRTPSFTAYVDARANRRDAFFIRPAGGADLCNLPVPVRRVP
jgi:peptidylprolyl isomerase